MCKQLRVTYACGHSQMGKVIRNPGCWSRDEWGHYFCNHAKYDIEDRWEASRCPSCGGVASPFTQQVPFHSQVPYEPIDNVQTQKIRYYNYVDPRNPYSRDNQENLHFDEENNRWMYNGDRPSEPSIASSSSTGHDRQSDARESQTGKKQTSNGKMEFDAMRNTWRWWDTGRFNWLYWNEEKQEWHP